MKVNNALKIAAYTVRDQMRHKSFYVLLGLAILFVVALRGCYNARYMVNGELVPSAAVALQVSRIVFQLIAAGMFLMASLLSMKIFSRDHEDGSVVLFLSRPVFRWQYVLGRLAGTWALCTVFMIILHSAIVLTVWTKTGTFVEGYLTASLVCSINLLFVIAGTCLLSLYMPDFISALFAMVIMFVGLISDGGYQIFNSDIARFALSSSTHWEPALWRILYPKVFMVQAYADSIISQSQFHTMGPLHPVLNLSGYILLILALMLGSFHRKEI